MRNGVVAKKIYKNFSSSFRQNIIILIILAKINIITRFGYYNYRGSKVSLATVDNCGTIAIIIIW